MAGKGKSNKPMIIGAVVGCLGLCLCGALGVGIFVVAGSSGGGGGDISGEIRTMSSLLEGGSSEWDMAVKPLMLAEYDSNMSGWLDTTGEVDQVSCETWRALDDGVKMKWDYGIRTIYGFKADMLWVGGEVGFDESVRAYADSKLAACTEGGAAAAAPAAAPAAAAAAGSASSLIRVIPSGGSSEWDTAVKGIMLAHYDSNNSGSINTSSEVGAIPCDTWSALNDGVKEGYSYGIRSIYGFEAGYSWVGYAVGFDESQRATADSKLVSCVGP